MFITRQDKAIGMIVDYRGAHKDVGVLLTKEINNTPIIINYMSSRWLAENTLNLKTFDDNYVYNLFFEHMKTLGASDEVVEKFKMFVPEDLKKELRKYEQDIHDKYEAFISKSNKSKKSVKKTSIIDTEYEQKLKPKKKGELFTKVEIKEIKTLDDKYLVSDSRSDMCRRIIIKYYGKKNEKDMMALAKVLWTGSKIPSNAIRYHIDELLAKGVIK